MISNLASDPLEYEINQNNFDFAVRLNFMAEAYFPGVNSNIHQYVRLRVANVSYSWVKDENGKSTTVIDFNELETVRCPSGRFNGENAATEAMGIEGNFWCVKDLKFLLKGAWGSKMTKFLNIAVLKCN